MEKSPQKSSRKEEKISKRESESEEERGPEIEDIRVPDVFMELERSSNSNADPAAAPNQDRIGQAGKSGKFEEKRFQLKLPKPKKSKKKKKLA